MTPDKELRYQARIRELREALEVALDRHSSYTWKFGDAAKFHSALSRPDNLSALEAYVREEKRKVLREVAGIIRADKCSGESGYAIAVNDATEKHADAIEKIAEGLK